jgi:ATP-binding cassette, subfamily B, bacterial
MPPKTVEADEKNRVRIILRILPFTIHTIFKSGRILVVFLILMTILSGLTPAAMVCVGKRVLDAVVSVIQSGGDAGAVRILTWALALQLAILIFGGLFSQAKSYLSFLTGKRLSLAINAEIIKKAGGLDYAYFEEPHFYDMMTRAQRESGSRFLLLLTQSTSIGTGLINLVLMGGMIATLSGPLFAAMLIVCIPLLWVQVKYGEKFYALDYERTEEMRTTGYLSNVMMNRQYVPEILSFGLWEYLYKKWYAKTHDFYRQDAQLYRRRSLAESVAMILTNAATVGATAYILYNFVTQGLTLTVGDVMMYSGAFAGGLGGARMAMDGVSGIYENALYLHNLIEFNKIKPRIEIRKKGKIAPEAVESIELQGVGFQYPDSKRYALKNINAIFSRSVSTLIVGANGAGKTTLIKLLNRLYDPTEGKILLNGVDIREYEIQSLRKSIGVIFQEFIRYAFSARENIACGSLENLDNDKRMTAAAQRAKADIFIKQFPGQYDTVLSRLFKGGRELSLGQWQRICLARLFMKDSPVFILDEPTAAVDIETETHLLKEIAQLSMGKICILVSHRLFQEGVADQVIVLNEGEIVESGSYENLLAGNRYFTRLWRLYHNIPEGQTAATNFPPAGTPISRDYIKL